VGDCAAEGRLLKASTIAHTEPQIQADSKCLPTGANNRAAGRRPAPADGRY
jgi:hypothetical protein